MKIIRNLFYKFPIPLQRFFHRIKNMIALASGRMDKNIDAVIHLYSDIFTPPRKKNCYLTNLKKDLRHSYGWNLVKPMEYFLFGFKDKTKQERREYLTDIEKDMYCNKYVGHKQFDSLMDKWNFYTLMSFYYKRDAMLLNGDTDPKEFVCFAKKYGRFIAKPNKGSFGMNTAVFDSSKCDILTVYETLMQNCHSWIIEELIVQSKEMAAFNPDSVNSVRVPTYRTKDGIEIYGCFMRTGRKGSVVDNAGAGGIFMKIDDEEGIVSSDGYTEHGEKYISHPDSNVKFKGFQVPHWKELLELAIRCHKDLQPQHKYVGWDFVLTNNGWVLMEGNWGQYLCQQVSSQSPMKKRFVYLIKN